MALKKHMHMTMYVNKNYVLEFKHKCHIECNNKSYMLICMSLLTITCLHIKAAVVTKMIVKSICLGI